ncbi:hypothetical protein PYK79_37735 [Streptomyces sp. ID05-04B]|uniref:hypothetical protein n=1 Tax=unclassified Streptomyces TaxID=2593676 RepID=UPI000D1AD6EE|nr:MULTISPECIES: hypothetical protein [unclassified Streptomyces]AVV44733.1 hypothetical protein C6376_28245 [Streptomyces sp. P3]MDX5567851.1 hypothetical protein [Streptomyces sp. ID05-04B]
MLHTVQEFWVGTKVCVAMRDQDGLLDGAEMPQAGNASDILRWVGLPGRQPCLPSWCHREREDYDC